MNRLSGCSGTPLSKKLGIEPSLRIRTGNAPDDDAGLLAPLPTGVLVSTRLRSSIDSNLADDPGYNSIT